MLQTLFLCYFNALKTHSVGIWNELDIILAENLEIMFTCKCICDEEMAEIDIISYYWAARNLYNVLKEDLTHINLLSLRSFPIEIF